MTTTDQTGLGNFVSTMLISKMHKKENYNLNKNLDYTLSHPNLAKIPQSVIRYFMILLNLLVGLVFVIALEELKITDLIVIFLAFIVGYVLMNQLQKKFYNKTQTSVQELNTFVVASKYMDNNSLL